MLNSTQNTFYAVKPGQVDCLGIHALVSLKHIFEPMSSVGMARSMQWFTWVYDKRKQSRHLASLRHSDMPGGTTYQEAACAPQ
jgi:hypothetical protein